MDLEVGVPLAMIMIGSIIGGGYLLLAQFGFNKKGKVSDLFKSISSERHQEVGYSITVCCITIAVGMLILFCNFLSAMWDKIVN